MKTATISEAKCEKCIHFWRIKNTDTAYCTAPQVMKWKTKRQIKNFNVCDFYEVV